MAGLWDQRDHPYSVKRLNSDTTIHTKPSLSEESWHSVHSCIMPSVLMFMLSAREAEERNQRAFQLLLVLELIY